MTSSGAGCDSTPSRISSFQTNEGLPRGGYKAISCSTTKCIAYKYEFEITLFALMLTASQRSLIASMYMREWGKD
jgi:hypothetical protein